MSVAEVYRSFSLVRPALAIELADHLRRMIMEGEMKPGEKVQEKVLTERFGVSRTPLREALKVLAAEGFVQLVPNRGAIVARQTVEEIDEVFPIVAALEGAAGELAAKSATDREIAEIRRLNCAMHAAFEAMDRPSYFDLNQKIHEAILTTARNPTLSQHHRTLAHRIYRARYQANLGAERWRQALCEHDVIIETLEARKGKKLGELLKRHFETTLATYRDSIK